VGLAVGCRDEAACPGVQELAVRGRAAYFRYGHSARRLSQIRRYAWMRLALFMPLRNPLPLPGDSWRPGSLDSHLGGARTLILPGRMGPATRESA
jgi:RNA-directed DNA polymerase